MPILVSAIDDLTLEEFNIYPDWKPINELKKSYQHRLISDYFLHIQWLYPDEVKYEMDNRLIIQWIIVIPYR